MEEAISTLSSFPLKLVDKFTYAGNSVSSTESYVDIHQVTAWTARDRLLVIWKSDPSDKIKQDFFPAVSILLYGCTTCTLTKHIEKSYILTTQEWYELSWTNPGSNTKRNNSCTVTYLRSQNHSSKKNKICGTLLEKQGRIHKWRSSMDPYTWMCQCWPTSKNLFILALCGHRM